MTKTILNTVAVADAIRELVLTRSLTISEAVDRVLDEHDLSEEARVFYLREGLISHLNNDHHRDRSRTEALWRVNDPIPPSGPVPKATFAALGMIHTGAAGRPKPLLDFDSRDWATLESVCRAQAAGWLKRASVAAAARAACQRFGAKKTRNLPAEALRELNKAAEDAWAVGSEE